MATKKLLSLACVRFLFSVIASTVLCAEWGLTDSPSMDDSHKQQIQVMPQKTLSEGIMSRFHFSTMLKVNAYDIDVASLIIAVPFFLIHLYHT